MMHTILFTGHMIDAATRQQPRFPKEKEVAARQEIKTRLLQEKENKTGPWQGIAGGACGGDILFHEACVEVGIPSQIYLALPPEEFKKQSVSFAGKEWDDRFDALMKKLPVRILSEADKEGKNIWEAANDEMLQEALKGGGHHMTLIALWNGEGGDGPGGTQHLVEVAKTQEGDVSIIDTGHL